jgi:sulfite reductase beta subunit-like hemoprotein
LVYEKLKAVGLGRAGVGQVGNFTSCPGKEHCKGAQGYSFASEVQGPLEEMSETFPEDVLEGTVRISGCLNQCGRTSLASLGLAGDWKRDADSQKRVVHLFLGGGVYEEGSRIARYAGWVQLERLENFVREFSGRFRELRKEKEDFGHYCLRASEDRSLLPGSGFVQEGKFSDQSGPGFEGEC